MKLNELRQMARDLGADKVGRTRKDAIIKIQAAEGNSTCFDIDWKASCAVNDCSWREECRA
ncbi:MAG: SAP domain-containing protein [Mariprofundaceae bacterium]